MGKRTLSVEDNRKHQAERVAGVLTIFNQRFLARKAKRLERWLKKHSEDKLPPPRHIVET